MLQTQTQLNISEFSRLYDILVPHDNELRQINELINFSFMYDELKDKYSAKMVMQRTPTPLVQFRVIY